MLNYRSCENEEGYPLSP